MHSFTIENVVTIQVIQPDPPLSPLGQMLREIEQFAPLPSDGRAYSDYHQTVRALIAAMTIDGDE